MKKVIYTESQILSQQERGITVADICRENGISNAAFFNWKARYGGIFLSQFYTIFPVQPFPECT